MRTFDSIGARRFLIAVISSVGFLVVADQLISQTKPTDASPQDLRQTFVDEFVPITPGKGKFPASFKMGSDSGSANEAPVHEVTLKRPFAIARYEIPQNLYQAVMKTNPSKWKGPRNSVEMISWKDAVRFCELVTAQLKTDKLLKDDEEIRLPTEAEWEYCCRAGTTTAYSFGDSATRGGDLGKKASELDAYGWHTGNAAGNDPPVGALKPNPWGLYDMHGYLWEFVQDGYQPDYSNSPKDGSAAKAIGANIGKYVIRGGSWQDQYQLLRSAARRAVTSQETGDEIGFRCVKAKRN